MVLQWTTDSQPVYSDTESTLKVVVMVANANVKEQEVASFAASGIFAGP